MVQRMGKLGGVLLAVAVLLTGCQSLDVYKRQFEAKYKTRNTIVSAHKDDIQAPITFMGGKSKRLIHVLTLAPTVVAIVYCLSLPIEINN